MRSKIAAAAALLLVVSSAAQDINSSHDHDEGDHGSHETHEEGHFEAAALYEVGAGTSSLIMLPADIAEVAFMVVPAASGDEDGLEGAEEDAEAAWDAYVSGAEAPTVLASGESATPSASVVYRVALGGSLVVVPVDVAAAGAQAVFLEHGADEVETALVSPSGSVLAPTVEEGAGGATADAEASATADESTSRATGSQWANALVASFVVSIISLVGLVVVVNKRVANSINLTHAAILASGALLTASLLHIVPEALEGLEAKYDNLHDLGLYAGLAILGGVSFGILTHSLMESGHSHSHNHAHHHTRGGAAAVTKVVDEKDGVAPGSTSVQARAPMDASSAAVPPPPRMSDAGTMESASEVTQPPSPAELSSTNLHALISSRKGRSLRDIKGLQPVCWNIIIGDLVHNFADGVTIGVAFLTCSTTIGWTVTASAVLHEVPHELADFMALMNGGMSMAQAFAYNFLSALSAVAGTIIILALGDTLSDDQTSFILLVGGGSFIFIALAELLPEALVVSDAVSKRGSGAVLRSQLQKLGSFLVGGVLIGLPLLFDQHCAVGHAGHNH